MPEHIYRIVNFVLSTFLKLSISNRFLFALGNFQSSFSECDVSFECQDMLPFKFFHFVAIDIFLSTFCWMQGSHLAFKKAKSAKFGLYRSCLPEIKWIGNLASFECLRK